MKAISAQLQDHLAGDTVTISLCARVVRTDAVEFFFTEHDEPIVYDGDTYLPSTIILSTNLESNAKLSPDNVDFNVFFDSTLITEQDVLAKLYDYADVFMFHINWEDTSQGILRSFRGKLGEVSIGDNSFSVELRSLSQLLQQRTERQYNADCDADLGDTRCKVVLSGITVSGSVTSVVDTANFTDSTRLEANNIFNYGQLTWTSGNNQGRRIEVKDFDTGSFELFEAMPFEIQVGDTYDVYEGCDKRTDTCINKFNNYVNFRGFPHIVGPDDMLNLFE